MDDSDFERIGWHAERGGDHVGQRIDHAEGEAARGRIAAKHVFEAALGDWIGDRAELEIWHAGEFRYLRRRQGQRRGIGAEDGRNLVDRDQAPRFADGLVGIDRVAFHEFDLLAVYATGSIPLFRRYFKTAKAFVAE